MYSVPSSVFPRSVDGDNVRVVQLTGGSSLSMKTLDGVLRCDQLRFDELHRDRFLEHDVDGTVDGSHPARFEQSVYSVLAR